MFLGLLVSTLAPAFACPYAGTGDGPSSASVDEASATRCATSIRLVGASCSSSTSLMARRGVGGGAPWTGKGSLSFPTDLLESGVSAPVGFQPEPSVRVVANELVQVLMDSGHACERLSLTGRWLDVDGVRYVVITSFEVIVP